MPEKDRYNLGRFVEAQARDYRTALYELKDGRKRSHWIWYIFPQYAGLGRSHTAEHYAIGSLDEARAYLEHPLLGPHLSECCEVLLATERRSARDILGMPDDMKLRSCATLFAAVSEDDSVFHRILAKYFAAEPDAKTLALIKPG
ncbi:DUF1810 domain-containing protein [Marinobacterium mangrovicola]|uniref:Uncharacterized protein (DUF1810 family) n=1 Tax=Marinobacterium mangrovicola TaxID=1476959 RepID=A0A4R1GQL0_9GAMM|nr:DUF1810 domain-containing protein [Marinobacterium mangrovicola]TCK09295.1 uncharacterized protein (DUF1810 family) [Marinobacterium mangrovicola]